MKTLVKFLTKVVQERETVKRNFEFEAEIAATVVVPDSLAIIELADGSLVEVICKTIRLVDGRNVYNCVTPDFTKAYRNIDQDKIVVA